MKIWLSFLHSLELFLKNSLIHSFWTEYSTVALNQCCKSASLYADLGPAFHVSPGFNVTKVELCDTFLTYLSHRKMISVSGNLQCLYSLRFNILQCANLNPDGQPYPYQEQCCGTVTIYYGSGSGSGSDF